MLTYGCDSLPEVENLTNQEVYSIAEDISEGRLDQIGLINLDLSNQDKKRVTQEFGKIRGWKISEDNLDLAVQILFTNQSTDALTDPRYTTKQLALGSCAQQVEQDNGSTGQAYVAAIQTPNAGECGYDPDDKVLVFNLYWGGTDPDNARYWSSLWWVRSALNTCYSSGLSTNGLCSSTARTCIGSCALTILPNSDLYSIFLWHL